MKDLFGNEITEAEARRLLEREKKGGRNYLPRGYAAKPGTGPAGEKCKTCKFRHVKGNGGRKYQKCILNFAAWTAGPRTDILANAPACSKWQAIPPELLEIWKEYATLSRKIPTGYSMSSDMAGWRYSLGGRPLAPEIVAMIQRRDELSNRSDELEIQHGMNPYKKGK